ncbi:MAG: PAS domain S-box protein, partial [Thermoplasmata archaeon]
GREIYVEGSINGRFENGKFVSTRAIFRDVTERKKMEFKLRESEARLRALFDATTEMLILVDEDGNILDLNDAMAASLGGKKEEMIGKNMRDYLPPDIFEKRYAHALKNVKTKKPVQFEDERNGRFFHSTFYPVFDENGEVHRIAAFIKDITEEKKMQIQLKESEERYRSLMETAADGILIVDETLRIISGNKSAARIFGYSKKELSGKPLWEMMPKRLKDNFLKGIKKLNYMNISEFSRRTIEVVGLRKDGKEIPIELSFSMYEINGRRYFTSIIRDASERKKIEEELREREEKYRTIFETSPEVIVLFDRHGHIVDVNDRVRNWLGYTRKELIGKSIEKLPALSQESKKIAMRRFSQRFQKRKISSYDLEFITKSGAVVIGRVRGTVMENSDGRITGVLVMISDITEQKQFEEKLRESEEKLRTITSAAHDAILMMDNDGNISYWNKAAEKMFGYKAEEIIGKNLHMALAPPRFHEAHKKAFKKFRETGKGAAVGKSLELSALRKDGTEFPVELSLSSVKMDGRWHAIGIVRDITERKRAEVELKEAYDKIETLLNAAADGIRIVNRDFKVTALNDMMAELAGVKKSEGVGMLCSDMFGSEDCGTQNCTMMRVLKSGKKIKSRTLRRRFDGKMVPCLHVATPLKDEKGDIVGIIDDFRDITELERVEINLAKAHYKLRQQNEKLKRLNNLQKIFLNVTSHELRTPMAAIKGYADLLTMGTLGDLTDEQKEAISVMRRNIDRLDNLIKDILDISRLESGTLSIQPTKCDLLEIIAEVLATI